MSGPQPSTLALDAAQRHAVEQVARAGTTPQQLALRARIVLAAAAGRNNTQIAATLGVAAKTVRQWRERWLGVVAVPLPDLSVQERLADAPRSGAPAQITPAQVCQIVALACEAPTDSARPISHWTARELADELTARGIVATISPRHAARLLKRGISSPTGSAIG